MNTDNRQMLPIGTLLKGGEYSVVRYIASGGFGNTYEVEHTRLGKRLAMKEFFMRGINQREGTRVSVSVEENRSAFDQMRQKFFNEAKRLARLRELHIVEVTDFFEDNQTAYYTMSLIDGLSLAARMKSSGCPLTEQEVRHVLPQVLDALDCAHSQGVFHLDLKPGNIMEDGSGHVWLIDFGASKQLSATESQTLSTSTGLCYTPGFAPSEQVEGSTKYIGPWTDFYALGATLYNLLSNHLPPELSEVKYDGEQAFHFPPTVSSDMRRLVLWLMQPDFPQRPKSVSEIRQFVQRMNNAATVEEPAKQVVEEKDNNKTVRRDDKTVKRDDKTVKRDDNNTIKQDDKTKLHKKSFSIPKAMWIAWAIGLLMVIITIAVPKSGDTSTDYDNTIEIKPEVEPIIKAGNISWDSMDPVLQNLINNMVFVEGGTFMMGNDDGNEYDKYRDYSPAHQVTLSSFFIGKYEVTQEEWKTIMGTNPSFFNNGSLPVEQVSWDDCEEFIRKLNEKTHCVFRFPTEAEWEYAARGGQKRAGYIWIGCSNLDNLRLAAWYEDNSDKTSHDVGLMTANELGLYDMGGNVAEWCQDWYDWYKVDDLVNPKGPTNSINNNKVVRGGSWNYPAFGCLPYWRSQAVPSLSANTVGLRLACDAN